MHVGIVGPCSSGLLAEFLPDSGGIDIGWGGGSVVELVRALLKRGNRVSIITLSPDIAKPVRLDGPECTFHVFPTRMRRKMRDIYKLERNNLKEGIRAAKPDILHAHWTYEFALACLETDLPTVVTCRDNAFQILRYLSDPYRLGRLIIQLYVLRKARFLTAVSPYLVKSLQWLCRNPIELIPNAIEIRSAAECSYRPISQPIKIATVLNGWQRRKNPKRALRAFNLFRQEQPEAKLFMFGADFQEGGPAAQWADKNKLSENVYFHGPQPRVKVLQELKDMSLLLHPAFEESFGMAILEAMALGVPVVAGCDSGAVQWVLDEGHAGFMTDIKNVESISQTLLACVKQDDVRESKRANAYTRARTVFSSDAVASQYEKLYRKALSGDSGRPLIATNSR